MGHLSPHRPRVGLWHGVCLGSKLKKTLSCWHPVAAWRKWVLTLSIALFFSLPSFELCSFLLEMSFVQFHERFPVNVGCFRLLVRTHYSISAPLTHSSPPFWKGNEGLGGGEQQENSGQDSAVRSVVARGERMACCVWAATVLCVWPFSLRVLLFNYNRQLHHPFISIIPCSS